MRQQYDRLSLQAGDKQPCIGNAEFCLSLDHDIDIVALGVKFYNVDVQTFFGEEAFLLGCVIPRKLKLVKSFELE